MDIEGWEFEVADAFLEMPRESNLPYQISVETHGGWQVGKDGKYRLDMQLGEDGIYHVDKSRSTHLFFSKMASLGYVTVHKEDNPGCPHCVEWTLIRAACNLL